MWELEYQFSQSYSKSNFDADAIEEILNKLVDPKDKEFTSSKYLAHLFSGFSQETTARYREYCGGKYFDIIEFKNCMEKYNNGQFN